MAFKGAVKRGLDKAGRVLGILAFPWAMLMYSKSVLTSTGHSFSPQELTSGMFLSAVVVLLVFFFALAGMLAGRWKDFMRFSVGLGLLWLRLFCAVFSLLWFVNPGATLWGLLARARTTGFGMLLPFYYRFEEQLKILVLYVLIWAFLSLLLILFLPSHGISFGAHEGAWKRVLCHKNMLGIHVAFGVILLVLIGTEEARYWGVYCAVSNEKRKGYSEELKPSETTKSEWENH